MKLSLFRLVRPPSQSAESPDVDVTPVMNMFIILIPFLVSMAVFTHVSIIDFSVPAQMGQGMNDNSGKPKLKLTVLISNTFVGIAQGENLLDSLPVRSGVFPFDSLEKRLEYRRTQSDYPDEIVIASRDSVALKHVVNVMDIGRACGFSKIGISGATSDPAKGK